MARGLADQPTGERPGEQTCPKDARDVHLDSEVIEAGEIPNLFRVCLFHLVMCKKICQTVGVEPRKSLCRLEAPVGIEPTNRGFADLCLTTWLRRRET